MAAPVHLHDAPTAHWSGETAPGGCPRRRARPSESSTRPRSARPAVTDTGRRRGVGPGLRLRRPGRGGGGRPKARPIAPSRPATDGPGCLRAPRSIRRRQAQDPPELRGAAPRFELTRLGRGLARPGRLTGHRRLSRPSRSVRLVPAYTRCIDRPAVSHRREDAPGERTHPGPLRVRVRLRDRCQGGGRLRRRVRGFQQIESSGLDRPRSPNRVAMPRRGDAQPPPRRTRAPPRIRDQAARGRRFRDRVPSWAMRTPRTARPDQGRRPRGTPRPRPSARQAASAKYRAASSNSGGKQRGQRGQRHATSREQRAVRGGRHAARSDHPQHASSTNRSARSCREQHAVDVRASSATRRAPPRPDEPTAVATIGRRIRVALRRNSGARG